MATELGDSMKLDLIETLADLVRIPSVNPMGSNPVAGQNASEAGRDIYYEARLTEHLAQLLGTLGLPIARQTVEILPDGSRRENLLARLDGTPSLDEGGELMLWEVHQDTVPVDGMTVDPFGAEVRDGKLFGRGACDVKGGMAAMLVALARLCEQRPPQMPTIVLALTVNEEHGFSGARQLVRGFEEGTEPLLPRAPDVCVVAEPTNLDVVVAHKGVVRWNCHTRGRAVHSSQPELGENAIYRMAEVVTLLQEYSEEVVPTLATHARCGRPTMSVGTIAGGAGVNIVPETCRVAIDRRLVPGETPEKAYEHAVEFVRAGVAGGWQVEHDRPFIESPGLSDEANGPLAERLSQMARDVGGRGEIVGVPYGTDAAIVAVSGVPAVVFGPGSIEQAHTADEWIDLEQLDRASEIYYQLAAGRLE